MPDSDSKATNKLRFTYVVSFETDKQLTIQEAREQLIALLGSDFKISHGKGECVE